MRVLLAIIDIVLALILIFVIEYPVIKAKQVVYGRVAYASNLSALPVFVAKELGFFDSVRVRVPDSMFEEIEGLKAEEVDGVKNGKYQFGAGTDMPLFVYRAAIKPTAFKFVYFAETAGDAPMSALFGSKKVRYKSPKDLEDKKVGFLSTTKDDKFIKFIVKQDGGDPKKVKTIPLDPASMLTGIKDGLVDFIVAKGVYAQILKKMEDVKVVKNGIFENYITSPYLLGVGYTSVANLEFFKEPSKRIVKAVSMALDYIRKHPDEAERIAIKYLRVKELYARAGLDTTNIELMLPDFKKSYEIEPITVQDMADKCLQAEILLKPADFRNSFIDPGYLNYKK